MTTLLSAADQNRVAPDRLADRSGKRYPHHCHVTVAPSIAGDLGERLPSVIQAGRHPL
jgi:hypothetical protein